jgi:hypothetical protein
VSIPGQCIPMSSLGRANPGTRTQLTDCILYDVRRFQTLVDIRHRRNVNMSCDFCIRSTLVCWCHFGNAPCQNFACLDCTNVIRQGSGKCRQRVQRISVRLIIFSGFCRGTKVTQISCGITEVSSLRSIHKASNGKRKEWNSKSGFDHDLRFDYLLFISLRNYFYLLFDIYLYYSILFIFNH